MFKRRSLSRVLAGQWTAFALILTALFLVTAVLLLYILEDSFIDRRLREVAAQIERLDPLPPLPSQFHVYRDPRLPSDLAERFEQRRPGRIVEFRRADGSYVHARWSQTAAGEPFALVYDVSDQLTVNRALQRAWPYAFGLLLLLALAAQLLARRFVRQISGRLDDLLGLLRGERDPAALRDAASREAIMEFSELGQRFADAWQERLSTLERERTTLAFLAHELRTPLQSARISLALLRDDRQHVAAWSRLQRAVDRLARSSNAILWLAGDPREDHAQRCSLVALLNALTEELAPLAHIHQQTLHLEREHDAYWPLPADAAETLLANLLLNAIQHGSAGRITIRVSAAALSIDNPTGTQAAQGEHAIQDALFTTHGFGFGLTIAQRLAERFGLLLCHTNSPGRFEARLQNPAAETGNG